MAPTPAHPSARSNAPGAVDEVLELETLDTELETVDDELGVTLDIELETVTEDTATEAEDEELPLSMLTLPLPPQAVIAPVSNNVAIN